MYIFEVSKEYPELALEEVGMVLFLEPDRMSDEFLIVPEIDLKSIKRLAYARSCNELLFECNPEAIYKEVEKFDWNSVYNKSFAVKSNAGLGKEMADAIWSRINNPKVDLKNPKTIIKFLSINGIIYCCKELWTNTDKFSERKPHMRPESHPSSLDPKLARCMVNLAGSKNIIDPFCGSGGILIEAGLAGINYQGYDIDKIMVKRCLENLNSFKLEKNVKLGDALKTYYDHPVVSDLPYGRNTKVDNPDSLLENFLKKCKTRMIIGVDSKMDYKNIINNTNRTLKNEFSIYLHKSLTKKILIIV